MDVFHITDHQGDKLRDPTIARCIQQSLNITQKQKGSFGLVQVKIYNGNIVDVDHFTSRWNYLGITYIDRPSILSDIATVIFELSCAIDLGEVWAHSGCVACILYIHDQDMGQPTLNQTWLIYLGDYVVSVVEDHHFHDELWEMRPRSHAACQIHIEWLLYQMLQLYIDYNIRPPPLPIEDDQLSLAIKVMEANKRFPSGGGGNGIVCWPQESIESWRERDYLVVNKYFSWWMKGCIMHNEMERQRLVQSLLAAIERRMSQGLMEVHTLD